MIDTIIKFVLPVILKYISNHYEESLTYVLDMVYNDIKDKVNNIKKNKENKNKMSTINLQVKDKNGLNLPNININFSFNNISTNKVTDVNGNIVISGIPMDVDILINSKGNLGFNDNSTTVRFNDDTSKNVELVLTSSVDKIISDVKEKRDDTKAVVTSQPDIDMVKTTFEDSVKNTVTPTLQDLISKAYCEQQRLTAEMGTTHDFYVKYMRNPAEIMMITCLISGVSLGTERAFDKLKEYVDKI